MNTPAIDHALTLLERTCDYAEAEPARAELDALKSRLAELESRPFARAGDVRARTVKTTRWRVEFNSISSQWPHHKTWRRSSNEHHTLESALAEKRLYVEARIIRITTYTVTRPVVREARTDSFTDYHDDRDESGYWRFRVWPPMGNDTALWRGWSFLHPTEARHHYESTRAEAERACRKALRDMGYRVERAKT